MARFGYPDLTITLTDSGDTAKDISNDIITFNGFELEAVLEEITGAGQSTDFWAAVGFTDKSEIVIGFKYDDTTDKPLDLIDGALGSTRELVITWDGATASDVQTMDVILMKLSKAASLRSLHECTATLRPTGAIT